MEEARGGRRACVRPQLGPQHHRALWVSPKPLTTAGPELLQTEWPSVDLPNLFAGICSEVAPNPLDSAVRPPTHWTEAPHPAPSNKGKVKGRQVVSQNLKVCQSKAL